METLNNRRPAPTEQRTQVDVRSQPQYTRRNLLKRAALAGAMGLGLLGLAACGGGEPAKPEAQANLPASAPGDQTACAGSPDLAAKNTAARKALKYVDQSPDTTRLCSGCRFFKQPEGSAACGGSQILTGPITPTGYCSSWIARS